MDNFWQDAFDRAPEVFGLQEVERLFPGICPTQTLRNKMSQGRGPAFRKVGRRVVLSKWDFFAWLGSIQKTENKAR